jgi:hypothetical protein
MEDMADPFAGSFEDLAGAFAQTCANLSGSIAGTLIKSAGPVGAIAPGSGIGFGHGGAGSRRV